MFMSNKQPAINLTQVSEFQRQGFLLVESFFTHEEIQLMSKLIPGTPMPGSPKVILEKNGEVRSVFYEDGDAKIVDTICRLNRLVKSAEALLGSEVYMHQVKVNVKKALSGDVWEWHQDYIFWQQKDGMPFSDVLTAGIFLQDSNEFNGPLFLIPGSHKNGILDTEMYAVNSSEKAGDYSNDLSADLTFILKKEVLQQFVAEKGIVSAKGKAGSVLFFHGNVFHCSNNNLSPFDRNILFLTYNSTNNTLKTVAHPRPNFLANRNFQALEPVPDSALLQAFDFSLIGK